MLKNCFSTLKYLFSIFVFLNFISFTDNVAFAENNFEADFKLLEEVKTTLISRDDSYSNHDEFKFIRELYHVDDSVLAYYYHVLEEGNLKGFVIISEKEELPLILERGFFDNNKDTYFGDLLKNEQDKKAYYQPMSEPYFADNKEDLDTKIEELKRESIEEAEELNNEELFKDIERLDFGIDIADVSNIEEDIQYQIQNNSFKSNSIEYFSQENSDNELITSFAATLPKKLSVSRLWQRMPGVANPNSSCGPTVGAMIVNYNSKVRKMDKIRDSNYYKGDAKFINQMYYMMNSYFLGTNQYSFQKGLELQLNLDKNRFIGKSRGHAPGVEKPSFPNIVNAINKKYPLAMLTYLSSKDPYHWTLIVEYNDYGEIRYLNPDGGQNNNQASNFVAFSTLKDKAAYTYMALK